MFCEQGMITCLEKEKLKESSIVDAKIITNNIYKIYDTIGKVVEEFEIAEKEVRKDTQGNNLQGVIIQSIFQKTTSKINLEESNSIKEAEGYEVTDDIWEEVLGKSNSEDVKPSFEYNEELLNYVGVIGSDSEFIKMILKIGEVLTLIIAIVSVIMLYASFKMTYSERAKEFGMLSAIGMNKKQKKQITRKETLILGMFRSNYRNNYRTICISNDNKYSKYIIKRLYI